jgi:hypothetical protein
MSSRIFTVVTMQQNDLVGVAAHPITSTPEVEPQTNTHVALTRPPLRISQCGGFVMLEQSIFTSDSLRLLDGDATTQLI